MRRVYLTVILTALAVLAVFGWLYMGKGGSFGPGKLKIGFVYEDDESTPYTYNFTLAEAALEEAYRDRIEIDRKNNVPANSTEEPVRELIRDGCGIIFANSYSEQILPLAEEFPDVQFCQVSFREGGLTECPENYHTFKGRAYEGRYVSGIAAGMKIRELIDRRAITADEALVGYVAAYPSAEVISGYTAFLLGIRSVAPEAVMRVRYTRSWGNFALEKKHTEELIREGCIVISQHSDTIGPAIACEENAGHKQIFLVGYNQSMMDVAPSTALVSSRINWTPYITGAVGAVLERREIEKSVKGDVHGNDIGAGFSLGWVEMLELNTYIAAPNTQKKMNEAIDAFKRGSIQVFKGDYIGENPEDETDIYDLNQGYKENESYSSPSFHYILRDVITIEE